MQVGHKKHEHCSHALEEDAPKVLGHGSISEWAIMATERRTPWFGGGTCKTAGTKFYLGIRYSVCRNSKGGGLHINLIPFYLIMKMNCLLTPPLVPTVQPSFVAITYGLIIASLVVVAHHNGRRGIPPSDLHGKCKPSSFSQS